MTQAVTLTATDIGTPITGVVSTSDVTVDMTQVTSATLVISGIGSKAATIVSSTTSAVTLKWVYDGTLPRGSYECWWHVVYANGNAQSAPTGSSLAIQVTVAV